RVFSFAGAALGSLAVLAGLIYLLYSGSELPSDASGNKPLLVYCAAALKPAMQAVAADYERETGVRIEFRFGNSEQVLANASLSREGDLFLPADESFVRAAEAQGLVAETFPLAEMRAVVLTKAGNPRGIVHFKDLLQPGLKLGQANPDAAAIGKVTLDHLQQLGLWNELAAHTLVYHTTVTDAANAVLAGSNDATIVWDAVAANYPNLAMVRLPELDGAIGKVELAVLRSAMDRGAAERLVRFVRSPEHGAAAFRAAGFTDFEVAP
ncbi:MAG TPA: extracellular solute-binding protein, partial [Gemmataceae bacterium]